MTAGKIKQVLFKLEYKARQTNINLLEKVKRRHFYEPLEDKNGMTSFL